MAKEARIRRCAPDDPVVSAFLQTQSAQKFAGASTPSPETTDVFLAERDGKPLGCIAARVNGASTEITYLSVCPEEAFGPMPEILIETIETNARSLRHGVITTCPEVPAPRPGSPFYQTGFSEEAASGRLQKPLQRRPSAERPAPIDRTPPRLR